MACKKYKSRYANKTPWKHDFLSLIIFEAFFLLKLFSFKCFNFENYLALENSQIQKVSWLLLHQVQWPKSFDSETLMAYFYDSWVCEKKLKLIHYAIKRWPWQSGQERLAESNTTRERREKRVWSNENRWLQRFMVRHIP